MGQGIAGYVAKTGQPLIIPNVGVDRVWAPFAAAHTELNLQSIACLPLRHGNRTLLREPDEQGAMRHWILEIHFVDRARQIGGFFEELLRFSGGSASTRNRPPP